MFSLWTCCEKRFQSKNSWATSETSFTRWVKARKNLLNLTQSKEDKKPWRQQIWCLGQWDWTVVTCLGHKNYWPSGATRLQTRKRLQHFRETLVNQPKLFFETTSVKIWNLRFAKNVILLILIFPNLHYFVTFRFKCTGTDYTVHKHAWLSLYEQ